MRKENSGPDCACYSILMFLTSSFFCLHCFFFRQILISLMVVTLLNFIKLMFLDFFLIGKMMFLDE